MSSCDDLFYLDVDYSSVRDGCYEVSTNSTINGENAYFLDGVEEDAGSSLVYATGRIMDETLVWTLANLDDDYDGGTWDTTLLCRDAAFGNASTLHPSEVAQWDCYSSEDGDYTRVDEITINCSCGPTPAPIEGALIATPFPTADSGDTEVTCDDLFHLDVDYFDIRDGCYEVSTNSTINGENTYFLNGIEEELGSSLVYATGLIMDETLVWVFAYLNEDYDGVSWDVTRLCRDAALGDASTQHPSEVAQWNCYNSEDDDYTRVDEITITCSCGTAPTPTADTTLAPSTSLITTPFPTTEIIVTPEPITPTPGPSTPLITTPFPTPESRAIVVTPAPTTPNPAASTTPIAAPSPTSWSEGNASTTPFTMSPLPEGSSTPATVASSGGGDASTMSVVAGAVGGGLVIGLIAVVVLLFKTGRLKPCRNGNSNEPPPGVGSNPAAAPATSGAMGGTQLPAAMQYPVPLQM